MTVYLIAATGTGGHIFPALSVARALVRRGDKVIWLGSSGGFEADYCKDFDYLPLDVGPVIGKSGKIIRLMKLFLSIPKVISFIKLHRVNKVIVFGGYISVPSGFAAFIARKPLFVQEQNALAGRANKLIKPFAHKIFTSYPKVLSSKRTYLLGNPLRYKKTWVRPSKVLVMGGSLGSLALIKIMKEVVSKVDDIDFKFIVGKNKMLNELSGIGNVECFDFVDDMAGLYDWADAVVARAGALTISEIKEFGLPALLLPLPSSADNHQYWNAVYAGSGFVFFEERMVKVSDILRWLEKGGNSAVDSIVSYI